MLPTSSALSLLGLPSGVPLTLDAMARSIALTVWPDAAPSPRLARFADRLTTTLASLGATVEPEATARNASGKVREGLVVLVPGPSPPDR
ncbi:MAG: hypothetical protein AAGF99_13780, partial [Bacteroidota bacterium]